MLSFLESHAGVLAAAACLLSLALLVWLAILSGRVRSVTPHMRHLVRDMEGKSAAEVLQEHLGNMELMTRRASEIKLLGEDLARRQHFSLQKVGFVRFDSEEELGGELSFSLALLDERDDGVLLTSIYRLEECRIYAKAVQAGRAEAGTSPEEDIALERARQWQGSSPPELDV
ncbi:MAG: DUF4446 family protein [Armatimonadota bacterium]